MSVTTLYAECGRGPKNPSFQLLIPPRKGRTQSQSHVQAAQSLSCSTLVSRVNPLQAKQIFHLFKGVISPLALLNSSRQSQSSREQRFYYTQMGSAHSQCGLSYVLQAQCLWEVQLRKLNTVLQWGLYFKDKFDVLQSLKYEGEKTLK